MEIRKDIYDQMINEAISSFPCECCGILAGKDKTATKIYPVKNIDACPESCFLMDPNTQYKIFKTIEKSNIDLVAIYHTHPNTECYPSHKDIDLARDVEYYNIIISLADIETPEVKAFKIVKDSILEEEVVVI